MLKAATLAAAVLLLAGPALAQAPKPVTTYRAPRAGDGHADLQGTWTNASLTRLERNPKYSSLILSEAQAAEIEGKNNKLLALASSPTRPDATTKDLPADCSDNRGRNCNYNAAWTDPGTTVMRVGGKPRSGFITSTPDGKVPPLTPEGRKRMAAAMSRRGASINDNPETRSLGERCILSFGNSAGPVMLPLLYNNTYEIVQTKDHVAIEVEMVHDARIVDMTRRRHLPPSIRPWMGDSVGWWEGDTLVIETTNYHPAQNFRGASENLKVTERLTRVGPDRMHYAFWVEDPTTWTQAWGGEYEFSRASGRLFEYACHEGNYGLPNILSGAREEDRTGVKTAPTNVDQAGGEDEGDEG